MDRRSAHTFDFAWTRYVCDIGEDDRIADQGFFPDYVARQPVENVLDESRCLVITGDPGVGKSTELRRAYRARRDEGCHALFIHAPEHRDMARAILEAPELRAWQEAGGQPLYLFIDSIDESPRTSRDVIGEVLTEIGRALATLPREQLVIRLGWRTAASGQEQALARLREALAGPHTAAGVDPVRMVKLAPLSREDAEHAAMEMGLDPERFLREVDALGIELLASRPLTLVFLLDLVSEGPLPGRRATIFERGCLRLCRWPDKDYRSSREIRAGLGKRTPLTPEQRLAVAMRIAAVTVLTQRPYVLLGSGAVPDSSSITAAEIASGEPAEDCGSEQLRITPQMIVDAVVDCGLFVEEDGSRYTWVHREYEHFLASRYLLRHGFTDAQLGSLLGYGAEQEHKVLVPQLAGLAAWIDSDFAPSVRRLLIRLDPVTQLQGDLAARTDEDKTAIVEELLAWYDKGRVSSLRALAWNRRLAGLAHPGLAETLRRMLRDMSRRPEARKAAAFLAGCCHVGELMSELADIATDIAEPSREVRIFAARAVRDSGDTKARGKLTELAHLAPGHDQEEILLSIGLLTAWDEECLEAEALYEGNRPLLLAEQGVIPSGDDIIARFGIQGLERALVWLNRMDGQARSFWLDKLRDSILSAALKHVVYESIAKPVTEAVRGMLGGHESLTGLREHLGEDPSALRAVLTRLLGEGESKISSFELSYYGLVNAKDAPWLLDWIGEEPRAELRHQVSELLTWSVPESAPSDEYWLIVERYLEDRERPEGEQRYRDFREYVSWDLDSESARKARQHEEKRQEWARKRKRKKRGNAPHRWTLEDIETSLNAVEAGDVREWLSLVYALTLADHPSAYQAYHGDVIGGESYPGWENASSEMRARVFTAAERFLCECTETQNDKLRTAALQAFALLAGYAPERLEHIPSHVWQTWTPLFGEHSFPPLGSTLLAKLAPFAKQHAADRLIHTFKALDERYLEFTIGSRWPLLWVPGLAPLLAAELTRPALAPTIVSEGLALLLHHAPELARPIADELLNRISPAASTAGTTDPQAKEQCDRWLATASAIIEHDATAHWPSIWSRIHKDARLGHRLLLRLTEFMERPRWLPRLTPGQLIELYAWLMETVPGIHDIPRSYSGLVTDTIRLRDLSGTILGVLQDAGNMPALEALYTLRSMRPEDERVRAILPKAEENARRNDWEPPTAAHILMLAADPGRRLIHHSSELAAAIADIAEGRIPGVHIPPSPFWQRVPGDAHQPSSESALPSLLRDALEPALAAISVRAPVVARCPGTLADIRVEAGITPGHYRFPIGVEIALIPSWLADPVAALDRLRAVLAERAEAQEPLYIVALVLHFSGYAWTRNADHERHREAAGRDPKDLVRQLEVRARDIERSVASASGANVDIKVACLRLELSETEHDLARGLPWGRALLDRLRAQGIHAVGFRSLGDENLWHCVLQLPEKELQERFSLAPHVLALACHGELSWPHVRRARDELALAHTRILDPGEHFDLDPDLLVLIDDAPNLNGRITRMPGRAGQLAVWPADDNAPLADRIAESLRRFDVFDVRTPVHGRQFIGRAHELAELERRIIGGESCGVFGLRKSGKTSLVRRVLDGLDPVSAAPTAGAGAAVGTQPRLLAVWLDVQDLVERDEETLWAALLERVHARLRAGGHEIASPTGSGYRDLQAALRHSLGDRRTPGQWCFVFDEADLFFEGLDNQPGIPVVRLLRMLRAMAQETGRVSSVFIGRDSSAFYEPELQGGQNPMLGWVSDYWMDALTRPDTDALLIALSRRVGLVLDDGHRAMAREWSGGHVILVRQFGSALLAVAQRHGGGLAGASEQEIVEAYLDRQMVRSAFEETVRLLRVRYPEAYALLRELLVTEEPANALGRHGGWIVPAAKSLRNFRLLGGSVTAPVMPRWLRWYGTRLGVITRDRANTSELSAAREPRVIPAAPEI